MVNWHSFNGIKSRPDELILLYAFVPSQSAILTLLCISEWQEHVQIFTLVIQGYKWQDTGEVLEVMSAWYSWVSRTVSPSWCLACPLSPWRQWLVVTGRPPLSPPLHCTVGQEAVFYNVCVSCGDVEWRNVSIPPRMNNRTSRTLCVIGRQKNQRLILINWYFPEVTDKRQSVN